MGADAFFGYQDIGEKGFIEWSLAYTMDPIIECFQAVPEGQRRERVLGKVSAPCCIMGHIALNEENLLKGFAQGITERKCPFPPELFDVFRPPTHGQLKEGIPDSLKLIDYWRTVRDETLTYLRKLTPEELRQRPEKSTLRDGDGNRDNPVREFFIMAIQHQNCHWGELRAICKILGVPMRW
jgi:hypothetical protein